MAVRRNTSFLGGCILSCNNSFLHRLNAPRTTESTLFQLFHPQVTIFAHGSHFRHYPPIFLIRETRSFLERQYKFPRLRTLPRAPRCVRRKPSILRQLVTTSSREEAIPLSDISNVLPPHQEKIETSPINLYAASPTLLDKTKELCMTYLELSKYRLSSLVVVSTMVGYYMAPGPFLWDQFLYTSLGTSLAIACANSFNQIFELKLDSQMARTAARMLPSGKISPLHATLFGLVTGTAGCTLLWTQVDVLAGSLAFSNILLYTLVYTPLKQVHPLNTWVGAVVGAIPPLIGWAANTGGVLTGGAGILGALLYLWQIPHFLALSYPLKDDYSRAGYKMLSVTNLPQVANVSFRYCLYMVPLSFLAACTGMTTWTFAADSLLCHAYLLAAAYRFKRDHDKPSARNLFFATIRFLPAFLLLMMIHKKPPDEKEKKNQKEKTD
jgi:protoheme IX farnesyltransferase